MNKKIKFVALILAIVAVCGCLFMACEKPKTFEERRAELKANYIAESAKAPKGGIVFLGDSITDGYDIAKYFKDYKVYNRGISGDTTADVLARLEETCLIMQPKIINLLVGINNLGADYSSALNGIEEIVKEILKSNKDTKIILQNLYPLNKNNQGKFHGYAGGIDNSMVDAINVEIEKVATKYGCIFVDMNSKLADSNGDFKIEYTSDGLHPTAKGYEVITSTLKPIVDKLAHECGII